MRKIQIVPYSKSKIMKKMLEEYLTELSEFDPDIKFDENGIPIYKWFDYYWKEKERYPIFLVVEDKIAGLAMIRELENEEYDFAEFYVSPEFRKDGNSFWFASEIIKLFDGSFTFATRHTNPRAIKFWQKISNEFGNGEFQDDKIWRNWKI